MILSVADLSLAVIELPAAGLIRCRLILLEGTAFVGCLQEEAFGNLHALGCLGQTNLCVEGVVVLRTMTLIIPLFIQNIHVGGYLTEDIQRRFHGRAVGTVVAGTR